MSAMHMNAKGVIDVGPACGQKNSIAFQHLGKTGNMISMGVSQSNNVSFVDFAFQHCGCAIANIKENSMCLVQHPCRDKRSGKNS